MKKLLLYSFFVLFTFAFGQTDSIKKMPSAYSERISKIDVQHMALDLHFDWKKKQAFGTTKIQLVLLQSTGKIYLDAVDLTINSVQTNDGTPLQFNFDTTKTDDALEIILPKIHQKNESLTIVIDYRTNWINESDPNNIGGSFGKGIRFFEPTSTTPIKRRQIWSSGQPHSNRYWFPAFDDISDVRTTEFTATVEPPLMVISNGNLIDIKTNSDGTRTFHYQSEMPYPNYLTSFVVGEYVDVQQKTGKTELHTFTYPDEKEAAEATIVRLPDMVKFFSEISGVNYPFSDYSQIMVQDYPFPGMVGQHTATIISDNMIDDFRTHADFYYLWDSVEAHALASQWFGNLLQPKNWKHFWLNESFSHYFDGLFTTDKNGKDEFLTYYLPFDHSLVFGDWSSGYHHPIVTDNMGDVSVFTSDNYTKTRGSLVLRMLRKELGEEQWDKGLKFYIQLNINKQVTTDDFQSAIEKTTGKSYGWFFEQWIYKMGHPVFEIDKKYDASKKQLIMNVQQVQKTDFNDEYPQNEFYKGTIEIEIDGKIKRVWLEAKPANQFIFNLPTAPKLVHFDCENTWIKEVTFTKATTELLYQLENDTDITGKIFALTELVTIAKDENTTTSDKEKIIASFRSVVLGKSYWRFRLNVLVQLRNLMTLPYDEATINMLLKLIKEDKPWVKTSAIAFLGLTKEAKYDTIYINAFNDSSDRVINAAANALGKSKSPNAFAALVQLKDKPSWKNQSLISTLNGLKELGDPRGIEIAFNALSDKKSPRWFLGTPVWDYPIAAVETLVALGKKETMYTMLLDRFNKSMEENDVNDIFANVLLITKSGDERALEIFPSLKAKFKDDVNAMNAINQYELQLKTS